MSTTNPSPQFKGLEQRMTRAVEGNLWGGQTGILELERKFGVADGWTLAHYHEWLEKLNWDQEDLHEELTQRREEGMPSTPKLFMPSPQTTLRQKEPAIPAGSGMLRTSPQVVLNDLLSQGCRRLQTTPKIHPVRRKLTFPVSMKGIQRSSNGTKEYNRPRRSSARRSPQALSWPKNNRLRRQNRNDGKP